MEDVELDHTEAPVVPQKRPRRTVYRRPGFAGSALGIVFWWYSLVPTLLPRSRMVQAVVSAVCVLAGYAIGSLLGWLVQLALRRWGREPGARLRRAAWTVLPFAGGAVFVVGVIVWPRWQNAQHQVIGGAKVSVVESAGSATVGVSLLLAFGVVCRLLWREIQGLDHWLDRRVSHPFAVLWTIVIVTLGMQIVVREVVWTGFVSWANNVYSATDRKTEAGIVQPTSPDVSGSPASLVPWDTLGFEGRTFVARATATDDLRAFQGPGATVTRPIRVYVGTRSSRSLEDQASLAVRELIRTGAFDRAVLVVATATGTGWIDPDAARSIEQLYAGDTAIVSMQYSYLPSWIAFLIDQAESAPAGSILFNAVYQEWARRPVSSRPKLVVFGESLGAYGAEAPFAGFDARTSLGNLVARTDGALFAGPVSNNPIWSKIVGERAAGSPTWRPVFEDGATVRVFTSTDDLAHLDPAWRGPRVGYLVFPSDPVAVFDLSAFLSRPGWSRAPLGADVAPNVGWFPIVTGVQSLGDLVSAFHAPVGHGHNYQLDFVGAWANVLPPVGWTDADTARLERFLAG